MVFSAWRDGVVPFTVDGVGGEVDGGELLVGDFDAFGIFVLIQLGAHLEAGCSCRCCNQLDDRAVAAQGLAPPVDGDEREETMLDLVPFAGAGRQVTNREVVLVGWTDRQRS